MGRSVLIVDDHAAFRATARRVLEHAGHTVIGESADGEAALADADRLHPEVILLDVRLPGIDGFAVARELATWHAPPLVILTSTREEGAFGSRLANAPVLAFVEKRHLTPPIVADLLR
jgi:CheY-like chemotaxis protein